MNRKSEQEMIDKFVKWAEKQDDIRALLLTSSRTNPNAIVDVFSDYDVIVVVTDIHTFLDDSWLGDHGEVLAVYRDPVRLEYGFEKFTRVTNYQDGPKIDYTVWPMELLKRIVQEPELPDYLDDGYRVLLDKDNLAEGLKPPTYTAFIPAIPTSEEYQIIIEELFNDAGYVAKNLWRDNLFPVKLNLDYIMKAHCLRKMLEWRMEIDNDWSIKPGAYGRNLKKFISPVSWSELEKTYVGAGREENWEALFRTIALFRKVALEVGDRLGYSYPYKMDNHMLEYLRKVREWDKDQNRNNET